MHDSVNLKAAARPTAIIVTTEFVLEGETQRDALGMTGLEAVVIDHPLSSLTEAEEAPVVKLVDLVIREANAGCSGCPRTRVIPTPTRSGK